MVVTCPYCRDTVHVQAGFIVRHGSRYHGAFDMCAGSGTNYIQECCEINLGVRD